jgi:hypothetical protein
MPLIESQPIPTSEEEIKRIANRIREFAPEPEKVEEKEETKEEKEEERSEEETYWIRRKIEMA